MNTTHSSRFSLRLLAGLGLATMLGLAVGCSSGAVGPGSVIYHDGELDAGVTSSYSNTVAAAEKTVDQLQFVRVTDVKDGLTAALEARTAQDKKVHITITATDANLTHVSIRIDHLGEQELSEAILTKIKSNL